MAPPILYKWLGSPPANAVLMLADMIGLQLDCREPDWNKKEYKSPEYLKMNPMGTVPVLIDGDFVVSDSNAIMKYLLKMFGKERRQNLYPSDVRTRALVDQCLFFNAGVFFVRLKVVALPTLLEGLPGPTRRHIEDIEAGYGVVEAYLQHRQYVAADHLTIADLAVGTTAAFMQPIHELDENRFPRTADWLARLEREPSFDKFCAPGVTHLGKGLNMHWEINKNNIYVFVLVNGNSVYLMAPILYKLVGSPPANAVLMLADMIGLQLDCREPDWTKMEHKSPEYLKMNPMGTIPVLKDGDFVVSDSNAIMKYLLEMYGKERRQTLYPSDVRTRALVDQCLFFNAGVFFVRLKVVALPTLLEGLPGPTRRHIEDIEAGYGVVEAYLQHRQYVAADHLTIADLAVGTTAAFMQPIHELDDNRFPRTADWLARLEREPSFNKFSAPGVAQLGKRLKMFWEINKNK